MRKHATWIALGVVAIFAGVGVFFLTRWQAQKVRARRMAFAEELLESDRATEALELLVAENRPSDDEERQAFGRLQIEALRKAGLIEQLRQLYYTSPEWFRDDEEASLLVARAMLSTDDNSALDRLLENWRHREGLSPQWFALRVDRLLKKGDRGAAITMLKQQSPFPGKNDFGRLSRLALLNADAPEKAWEYLEQAYQADPENPTLRMFRGNVLEAAGRRSDARVEYIAAYVADPTNAGMCDQLAEFYRRCGNHAAAQSTWTELEDGHATDFIRLKQAFWSRLTSPTKITTPAPQGPWRDFAEFIRNLPADRFWNEREFQDLQESSTLAKLRQEVYWLRLFQLLQDHQRGRASLEEVRRHLVDSRVGARYSYSSDLQRALTLALAFQQRGDLNAPSIVREGPRKMSRRHRFFDQLDAAHYEFSLKGERYEPPADLAALLKDRKVFAVIAMTAGWTEAAVRLDDGQPLPKEAPAWAAYGMTQAFRMNRGVEAAIAYANKQPASPLLNVLRGELLLAAGDNEAAHQVLEKESTEPTEIGVRAAWLAAMAKIDEGQLDEATDIVESNTRLELSALGQETLAKISTLRGDAEAASEIYTAIADESFEAAAFAARRAFAQSDWETAERLTLKLLEQMPESMQLRQNLRAINEARRENEL